MRKTGEWMPFWVTGAASLLLCVTTRVSPLALGQLVLTTLVPAVLPLLGRATGRTFSPLINWVITGHLLLASHLGSVLGFYARFSWWDLLMHGSFGLVAAVALYGLLMREHPNTFGSWLLLFLAVMGSGAMWELMEFASDLLFHGDAQRVGQALREGVSPIRDTMTDLLVTIIGPLLMGIWLWIQKKKPSDD